MADYLNEDTVNVQAHQCKMEYTGMRGQRKLEVSKLLNCVATAVLSTFLILVLLTFTVWLDDCILVDSIRDYKAFDPTTFVVQ